MQLNIKYCLIFALAATSCMAAKAQDLSTEITVDRIVEPSQRLASRPSLFPGLLPATTRSASPQAAEWLQTANATPLLSRLGPAAWEDSIAHSKYRGYISGGYFPTLSFGADAGYRFVDTPKAWFGAAFQYHGIDYNRDGYDLNHQSARFAFDCGYKPNDYSILLANIDYRYDRVQEPFFDPDDVEKFYYAQSANDFDISAKWLSQPGRISYDLEVTADIFRFAEASPAELAMSSDPLTQSLVKFKVGVGLADDGRQRVPAIESPRRFGIDIDGSYLITNNDIPTLGLYRFAPYARFGNDAVKGKAGLSLFVSSGSGSSLQVAPELSLSYAPADKPFAASVSLTGGKEFNSMRDIFGIDPYVCPVASYDFSRVLMVLEAAITFGPIEGFEAQAFGGFALPRNWLMATTTSRIVGGGTVYTAVDAESMHLGLRASYSYKSLFRIGGSAEYAHSEDGVMTWYRWHDSAKYVFSAMAGARPIQGLDIELRYDLRRGRSILIGMPAEDTEKPARFNIGNASCFSARASYQINAQVTAFVNAEFHNKHLLISSLPAPTLTGLAGVSFKF